MPIRLYQQTKWYNSLLYWSSQSVSIQRHKELWSSSYPLRIETHSNIWVWKARKKGFQNRQDALFFGLGFKESCLEWKKKYWRLFISSENCLSLKNLKITLKTQRHGWLWKIVVRGIETLTILKSLKIKRANTWRKLRQKKVKKLLSLRKRSQTYFSEFWSLISKSALLNI